MSALPSTADIHQRGGYVSFVLITDTSANTSMPRKPRRELAVSRGRKHPRLAVAKYVPSPTCMMICPRLSLLSATSRCKAVTRAMLTRLMRNARLDGVSIEAWILPVQGNAVIDAKSPSAVPGDVEAA
jgi:hypothetical protein